MKLAALICQANKPIKIDKLTNLITHKVCKRIKTGTLNSQNGEFPSLNVPKSQTKINFSRKKDSKPKRTTFNIPKAFKSIRESTYLRVKLRMEYTSSTLIQHVIVSRG